MNAVLEQINSTGKAFVEFAVPMLVQSSVLILILLLADLALRKKVKAVFRYCIWMLVLIKLILPASLSSPLSLGYWFGDHLAYVAESRTAAAPEAEALESALADMLHIIEPVPVEEGRPTPAVLPMMPGVEPAEAEPVSSPMVSVTPVTWQGVVFLVWLSVVIAMGLLLLQRAMFVRGLVAQAKEANALMNDALKYCCKCMGVKRKIGLKVSANATSPAVCGLFRPVILVPHKLAPSLGSRGLRAVLLHELAHIRRGDLWVNLAQTVLQIGYFYNPLLWAANCVIRRVREQAIDETVLVAMGEKAQQYPQTLVNVAKLAFKRPALSLRLIGVVESKSALAGRIKHILNRPMPKSAKVGVLGLAAVLIIGAVLLPMAKAAQFTDHTRQIMKLAKQEARQLNHEYIGTEHILLALVKEGRGVSGIVLRKHDVNIEKVRSEVRKLVRSGPEVVVTKKLPKTPRAKRAMKYAKEEAKVSGHDYIGAEHILLGLLREKDGVAAQVLMKLGLKLEDARQEVLNVVGPKPKKGGYPTLVISGVVTDLATGNPIVGARVGDDGYGPKPYRSAVTGSDGQYYYLTWPEHHGIKAQAAGYKVQRKSLYEGHFTFNKEMVEEVFDFALEAGRRYGYDHFVGKYAMARHPDKAAFEITKKGDIFIFSDLGGPKFEMEISLRGLEGRKFEMEKGRDELKFGNPRYRFCVRYKPSENSYSLDKLDMRGEVQDAVTWQLTELVKLSAEKSEESDVRVGVEKSISPKLTMLLGAINSCAAQTKLNIDSISITARKINIKGDTSGRTNTQKFLDAIRKNELEILQLNLDTRDGRDKFSIIVEPKKDWQKWWQQHKTDVHVGIEKTISSKLMMVLGAINSCAAEAELNIESISITAKKISIAGDTSSRTNTQKFLDAIKKNELEILQLNLDTRDGRDKFRIIVEPSNKTSESKGAEPTVKEPSEHAGRISGVVVNSVTGQPIAGAYVGVGDFGDSGGSNYSRHRSQGFHDKTETDEKGRFELDGLVFTDKNPEMDYHSLLATHPDFVRHDEKVKLLKDESVPDIKISLRPAARIDVTVVDENDKPLKGLWLLRLEALDGRRFIPPGGDPHLSSFASSIWAHWPDLRTKMGVSQGFTFTELDTGEYSVEAIRFHLVDNPTPQNIWKPTVTYHGSIPTIEIQAGQAKEVKLWPQDHQTRLTITPPEFPEMLLGKLKRSSHMPLLCLISRSPGLLLWDDGKIHHLEDQRLGRIDKKRFFRGFFSQGKPLTVNNLPPGLYSLFTVAVYGEVAGCLIGARAELAKGDDVTVEIPWRQPTGPSMVGPNRAFDYPVKLEARDYSVSELCELLTAITKSNPRIVADMSIENEMLKLGERQMSIWDVLEALYLQKGWKVVEGQEKTLILQPGVKTDVQVEEKLKKLFQQLRALEAEKKTVAKKHWNEMSKEQQRRYIAKQGAFKGYTYEELEQMSREPPPSVVDKARTVVPWVWRRMVSSDDHLTNDEKLLFRKKESVLIAKIAAFGRPAIPLLIEKTHFTAEDAALLNMWANGPLKISGLSGEETILERKWATMALSRIGKAAVPELLAALKNEDGWVRSYAARVLGNIKDKSATEPLIECLADKEKNVRFAAARALVEIGDTRAVQALVKALKDDDSNVRWPVVEGLGKFGDSTCIQPLEELKRRAKGDLLERIAQAVQAIKAREANEPGPKITFEKVIHDFGEIAPGTQHSCEFKFTNTGEGLLKIGKIHTPCNCTAPMLKKKEYTPGESGTIKVTYKAGSKTGVTSKQLYVSSNDKKNPRITLTIKARIVVKVEHKPERLNLLLKDDNAGCPEITLTGLDNQPFAITQFKSTANSITADFEPSVKKTKFVIRPKVDVEKLRRALNGRISISLTHPQCRTVTIPFSTLPRFKITPPSLITLKAESQKPTKRKVRILNNYNEDFEIESASSQKGIVKVLSQEKTRGGYQFELEITPPVAEGNKRLFTDVFIVNIKGGEVLKISCRGFYSRK